MDIVATFVCFFFGFFSEQVYWFFFFIGLFFLLLYEGPLYNLMTTILKVLV